MSPGETTPRTPVYRRVDDDRDMLESLKGLSLQGFQDDDESVHHISTPTSTNASLSTPPALKSSRVFLASSPYALDDTFGHAWYAEELKYPMKMPNTPMMKDLDSFTDGTGHGSFDFPLSTGGGGGGDDLLPLIFHPPTHYDDINTPTTDQPHSQLALDMLPTPSSLTDTVLAWREGVSATTSAPLEASQSPSRPPPKKRRRSLTLDSDHPSLDRRVRAWSPNDEAYDYPLPTLASETCDTDRSEPPAPG